MESGYGGSESSVGEEEEDATASAASTSVTSAEEGQKEEEEEERVAAPASGEDAEVVEEGNSKDTEDLEVRKDKYPGLVVSKGTRKIRYF